MNYLAIIDVPKQDGSPRLLLPEDAVVDKRGKIWHVSWNENQAFFYVLRSTTTRWIGFIAAPKKLYFGWRIILWMENKLGADVYRVTPTLVKNQRTALENLGLTFDEDGRMLAPHVLCGQSPWVSPEV
jgi:hypothetical protein